MDREIFVQGNRKPIFAWVAVEDGVTIVRHFEHQKMSDADGFYRPGWTGEDAQSFCDYLNKHP